MAMPGKKGGGGRQVRGEELTRLLLAVSGGHVCDLLLVDTNE